MTRGVKHIVQGTGTSVLVSCLGERYRVMANERAFRSCVHSPSLASSLIAFWSIIYRDLWDSFCYTRYSTKQGKTMNLSKNLKIEVKRNYGTDHIYPKCDTSKLLISMGPNKTFTPANINNLKKHGFSFETVAAQIVGA
jgi:hypothetical protein